MAVPFGIVKSWSYHLVEPEKMVHPSIWTNIFGWTTSMRLTQWADHFMGPPPNLAGPPPAVVRWSEPWFQDHLRVDKLVQNLP